MLKTPSICDGAAMRRGSCAAVFAASAWRVSCGVGLAASVRRIIVPMSFTVGRGEGRKRVRGNLLCEKKYI